MAIVVVVRAVTSADAAATIGVPVLAAAAGLVLFAGWTLLSATWSDATGRAVIEFDRVLLYLLAVVAFGSLGGGVRSLGWMVRGFAAATAIVSAVALTTRVAADVWPTAPNVAGERLSYPLTYWNALGLLTALGIVACVHLTSDPRERAPVRVLAAAAVPILATTLLLTYSRGAMAVAVIALAAYAALGRPRALPTALLATAPPVAVALVVAYRADALATAAFDSPAGIDQGHGVALAVALAAVVAAVVRALLLPVDARLERWRPARQKVRRTATASAVAALAALVVVSVAVDLPGRARDQVKRFAEGDPVVVDNARTRLTNASSNGRLDYWKASVEAFKDDRLKGSGAGTFQLTWARVRPVQFTVVDEHSLYGEVLGELGVVGLLLLAAALLPLLVGVARRALREPAGAGRRPLLAACFAALLAWAIHAGVDWDWEMPAVTLPVLALAAAALGRPSAPQAPATTPKRTIVPRALLPIGAVALIAMPLAAALSQSRLDDALAAMKDRRCGPAVSAALDANAALPVRAEPWEVVGYCRTRLGLGSAAIGALQKAVDRDPRNWEVHYGLALVTAAAGGDPRPAAAAALELNPKEPMVQNAVAAFAPRNRAHWRAEALRAPLPVPP